MAKKRRSEKRSSVKSLPGRRGILLFVLIPVAFQVYVFASHATSLMHAQSWASTTGTITGSGFSTRTETRLRRRGEPGVGGLMTTTFSSLDTVAFSFDAGGGAYESTTPSFFQRWTIGKNSPHYPKGSSVSVYYDPVDPQNAVLVRSVDSGFLLCLLVTLYALYMLASAGLLAAGVEGSPRMLGGGFFIGVGLLLFVGSLLANADRGPGEWVVIALFALIPAAIGTTIARSPWRHG